MTSARTVPVLMYHHISPSAGMITTSPEHFESQIAWFARNGYTSLTADQFAGHLQGKSVPERSILITFDDGYLDNWVYAHPILVKHGYRAVMFVVTDWVGKGAVRPFSGQGTVPATPTHKQCKAAVAQDRRDDVIVRWSEIQAMEKAGTFEFHSHTHTHTRWDRLSTSVSEKRERIADEFARSRASLQENLGQVSGHLCWPQGYFDQDYIELAGQAGFNYFYTTDAYGHNTAGADPQHIYRFAVRNRKGSTVGRRTRLAANLIWGPWYNQWKLWRRSRRQPL